MQLTIVIHSTSFSLLVVLDHSLTRTLHILQSQSEWKELPPHLLHLALWQKLHVSYISFTELVNLN